MRGSMAGLLNLVLHKVLQGSKFHLTASTSVYIILICNKPDVKETGGNQASASFPSRLRQEIPKDGIRTRAGMPAQPGAAENTLENT